VCNRHADVYVIKYVGKFDGARLINNNIIVNILKQILREETLKKV